MRGNANGHSDQQTFEATMPTSKALVTVTLRIYDCTDIIAFGALSFTPISQGEYTWLEFICNLRH